MWISAFAADVARLIAVANASSVGASPAVSASEHLAEHRLDRHRAGDLARRGAAHPVGDHEQRAAIADDVRAHLGLERRVAARQVGDDERVLVVLAHPADVGAAEHVHHDLVGRGGDRVLARGHRGS